MLFNVGFYGWTALLAIVALPVAAFLTPEQMRRYARFWMRGLQAILRVTVGLRYRVHGLENLPPGPAIIASKHQSAWETLFFHIIRPDIVIGLKHELRYVPIIGWYLGIGGNIFVDRGGAASALRSLVRGAREAVARGWSILIFPEGTRRPPGAPSAYKPGVAALYAALDVPVVPVALNSGLFWGRRTVLKRPGTITVEFLEPIAPGLERREFMRMLEERIESRSTALAADPES
jgi:1-acyl-sn-glycerol-3-phosphate acyltransferase